MDGPHKKGLLHTHHTHTRTVKSIRIATRALIIRCYLCVLSLLCICFGMLEAGMKGMCSRPKQYVCELKELAYSTTKLMHES